MKEPILYQSRGEGELLVRLSPTSGETAASAAVPLPVELDDRVTHQEVDGFGASFTDSAAYLIHQVLSEDVRNDLMEKLFHPEKGIGLSVLRNPMGASDFARTIYSYDDVPEGEADPQLQRFSIAHDEEDIIPLLKRALTINPDVKLFASPWSAPGWMKTSGSMITGELKPEYYPAYAEYFVRFVEAYGKAGLPVYAVTPQNEALFVPPHYPGMLMPPEAQAEFIREHLKPAFRRQKLAAKILCYDHNWDRPDYPLTVLEEAGADVDGVAWHWYNGEPAAQSRVAQAYPDKEVHFTEGSGGEWIPPFERAFSHVMRMGIEILRNHSKSFILWNMALDENNGPTVPGFGRSTCRGIVRINQQTGELEYTLDYYALAHFSKVIRPGARRIDCTAPIDALRSVAARNPDGTVGAVLFNDSAEAVDVVLNLRGRKAASFRLDAGNAMSVLLAG